MVKSAFSSLVRSQGTNDSESGGRGEYYLKRPNEFLSLDRGGKETAFTDTLVMSSNQDADIHNAAAMLSTLLPKHKEGKTSLSSSPSLPRYQECVPNNTVLRENQPYRTTPLVLPHAKTIHDTGEILYPSSSVVGGSQPYRNSSLVMAAPRTIHEVGVGAGPYKPYRGPQYYTDKKQTEKAQPVYNTPLPLYSTRTLSGSDNTTHMRNNNTESDILQVDTGDTQAGSQDTRNKNIKHPAMRDSSINQSASFKKVMYSVMGI